MPLTRIFKGGNMKKILTVLCLVLAGSLSFAGGGGGESEKPTPEGYLRSAKSSEAEKSFISAAKDYYNAMSEAKNKNVQKEAYEGYCRVLETIRSGNFCVKSATEEHTRERWEKFMYGFENAYFFFDCPIEFELEEIKKIRGDGKIPEPAERGATQKRKRGTRAPGKKTPKMKYSLEISVKASFVPTYEDVQKAAYDGWANASKKYGWKDLPGWPVKSTVTSEDACVICTMKDGSTKLLPFIPEAYKLTFKVVYKDGTVLKDNFVTLIPGEKGIVEDVDSELIELLENKSVLLAISKMNFIYPKTGLKDQKLAGKDAKHDNYYPSKLKFYDGAKTKPEDAYKKLAKTFGPYKMKETPVEPIKMVKVDGGTFIMATEGGDAIWYEELGGSDKFYELYGKQVKVSTFYMSEKLITQAQWFEVIGTNPTTDQLGDDFCVENISWFDAVYFCNLLSKKEGLQPCYTKDGMSDVALWDYEPGKGKMLNGGFSCDFNANGYRLLTDAEWVHACPSYDEFERLDEWVWDTYKELTKDYEEDPRETYVCGGQHITRGIKADKGCDARTLRKPQDPEKTVSIFWGGLGFRVARSKM